MRKRDLKLFENNANKQNINYIHDEIKRSDQIKDKMDGTCSKHWGNEEHKTFQSVKLKGSYHSRNLRTDANIIKLGLMELNYESVHWIQLALDSITWKVL
jgi:hypothetical protein